MKTDTVWDFLISDGRHWFKVVLHLIQKKLQDNVRTLGSRNCRYLCAIFHWLNIIYPLSGCLDVDTLEKRKYGPLLNVLDSIGVASPLFATSSLRTENKDINKVVESVYNPLFWIAMKAPKANIQAPKANFQTRLCKEELYQAGHNRHVHTVIKTLSRFLAPILSLLSLFLPPWANSINVYRPVLTSL